MISANVYHYIGSIHTVGGASMQPAMNPGPALGQQPSKSFLEYLGRPPGPKRSSTEYREKVWVNKLGITLGNYTPLHGDIIVFRSPKHATRIAIKRVVGIEGDLIQPSKGMRDPEVIKKHHVWVESDNFRTTCRDSNEYGQLHVGMIVGKVEHFIWPRMFQKVPGKLLPVEFEQYLHDEEVRGLHLPPIPQPPGISPQED